MASQLEIQVAINEAIASRTAVLKEQTDLLKGQVSIAAGLAKALSGAKPSEVTDAIKEMADALDKASTAAAQTADQNRKMGVAVSRAFTQARTPMSRARAVLIGFKNDFPLTAAAVAGFVDGFVSGFKFVYNSLKAAADLAFTFVATTVSLGKAIVSIPFRILEGLIGVSNKLAGYMEAIARATEEVRTQFGELVSGPGKAVIGMARELSGVLTSTGLTGYQVFGSLDEAIQFVNKTATEMGAVFETVREEIKGRTGAAILLMQKGLGLTGEMMGAVGLQSMAMGKSFQSSLVQITKASTDFGKRFGLSAKLISRDIGMMVKDVKNFGNLAPTELAKVSVYTKKLGLDVKDLLGVIDRFDTFEDAAISAAKLGQAFGVNVDAMRLMKAENPADRVDQLRQAFFAAGKSAELLNRQELKLLAQTTGLSEEAARAAFSSKNMGVSMSDLEKQGKLSEKRHISQEEALVRLSNAIERMVKTFGQFEGFIKAFADGFARGIFTQKEFMGTLAQLNRSLAATKRAGIEVGKTFVETFAGGAVKNMVMSFRSMIKLGRDANGALRPFPTLLKSISDGFTEFFATVQSDPDAVPTLLDRIRKSFEGFLGTADGEAFKSAAGNFAGAMGNIMAGMLRVIADGLEKGVNLFIAFLEGKELPELKDGGIASRLLTPILKEFEDGGAAQKIGKSMEKLFDKLWPIVQPHLEAFAVKVAQFLFTVAFVKAATSVAATAIGQVVASSISTWIGTGGATTLASTLGSGIAGAFAAINPAVWVAAAAALFVGLSVGVSKGMAKFQDDLKGQFGETEAMVGAAAAGIIDTLSFGLVPESVSMQIGELIATGTEKWIEMLEALPFGKALSKAWKDGIQSIIGVVATFGDLIMAVFDGDGKKIEDSAQALGKNLVKLVKVALKDLPPAIGNVLSGLGGKILDGMIIGLGWAFAEGLPLILSIASDIVSAILNVFSGMAYQMAEFAEGIPVIGGVLKFLLNGVGYLFELAGSAFSYFSDQLDTLKKSWGLFGKLFVEMLEGWRTSAIDIVNGIYTGIVGVFDKVVKAVSDVGTRIKEGFKGSLGGLTDIFSFIGVKGVDEMKKAWKISSPSAVAEGIGDNIVRGMMGSVGGMPEMILRVAEEGLDNLKGTMDGTSVARAFKGFASPMLNVVKGMVEEANEINKLMENIGPIDIDARLQQLADRLGIENQEFMIKHRDFRIQVNLNVVMEADKVADAVIDTRKVVATGEGL